MASTSTMKELRNMQIKDLRREAREQRATIAKLHLTIEMGKEKDTAKYQRAKTQLARTMTILTEKESSTSHSATVQDKAEKDSPEKSSKKSS